MANQVTGRVTAKQTVVRGGQHAMKAPTVRVALHTDGNAGNKADWGRHYIYTLIMKRLSLGKCSRDRYHCNEGVSCNV